jgi:parvulin-like peptidyl-prolyl isomerase
VDPFPFPPTRNKTQEVIEPVKRPFAFFLSALLALPAGAAQVVNRTLATVNGEPILQSDFEKTYAALTEEMPDSTPIEARRENKKKLLDNLIDQKLLLQEAKKRKLRVSQRDLETGIIQVRARFLPPQGQQALQKIIESQSEGKENVPPDLAAAWKTLEKDKPGLVKESQANFDKELINEGLTAKKFEDRIREQLLANQLTQEEVRGKLKPPTEPQVKALYDDLLAVMQGKKPSAAAQEDLGELAKFFEAQTGEKVRARHILVKVASGASMKDKSAALKKARDLRKKIADGADFGEVAAKESDDKGSAQRGGDLGGLSRGQTVPAFEKAVFDLPVGKLSDVVETDFGYHIILVEEKRAAGKLRYDDVKEDLADYLMNAQGRETLMAFVKDLRKTASIKVHVENLDEVGEK